MRAVFTYPFSKEDKGGIASCVPSLIRECSFQGVKSQFVSQLWFQDDAANTTPSGVTTHFARSGDKSGFGYSRGLRRLLTSKMINVDLVHSHGMWMYLDKASFSVARSLGKPVVVTPHGMLEPWALANSSNKKKLMRLLFENRRLAGAACIHALCRLEAQNIHDLGFKTPIAVIPNGINLSEYSALPGREAMGEKFPHLKDRKIILFLARIHPKKGLLHLVEAWSRLSRQFPEWHLVIAGPEEGGHQAVLQQAIGNLGVVHQTSFVGMLAGDDKLVALATADIFVLPSFSEGFSMAILEAMACKVPVLLTPQCNFPEAVAAGAAIEVDPDAQSTYQGLEALLQMTDSQRAAMGEKGNRLVAKDYSWKKVAEDMIKVYQWCLGTGPLPQGVMFDR